MPEVSVTGTREGRALAETPAAVGVVGEQTLRQDRPTHPQQVIGLVPGAAVAVTNGEGHSTAIRQPFTTGAVYLFLEDGVPTRSTGFFNHNALYEINLPQAGGVEVTRGPGSALYGSDAIGGVINSLTRKPPPAGREASWSAEVGGHGWRRLLLGGGQALEDGGLRGDLNLTHTDGWRQRTAYDRQSANLRWDVAPDASSTVKTVLAATHVDQETGANSPLPEPVYRDDPTRNFRSIAYRKVDALRLSSAWEREDGDTLWSVTPYVRDNRMELLASFALANDPTVSNTENQSFGLLGKWRRDFAERRARLIAGVDLDYSPGGRKENRISLTQTGSGANRQYLAYSLAGLAYDYDVSFQGVSPYVHGEYSATDRLRLSAGLRYDDLSYRFDNHLAAGANTVASSVNGGAPTNSFYGQAEDTTRRFHHLSPKLGLTYALSPTLSTHLSYSHGFRAPSESQLFRPSVEATALNAVIAAQSALGLKPVKVDQVEVGLRREDKSGVSYELVVYQLIKRDDIVSLRNTATDATRVTNAGKTSHKGVEIGLGAPLARFFRADVAWSYAKHFYDDWVSNGTNLSGNEMESAPRVLATSRLTWLPAVGQRLQLEWVHLGSYWMDQQNTQKYAGHDLFNLRGETAVTSSVSLFGSVTNLADKRYADSSQVSSGTRMLSPGLPRTYYAGVEVKW
jgi:iron complex outermembrane recepter protein